MILMKKRERKEGSMGKDEERGEGSMGSKEEGRGRNC